MASHFSRTDERAGDRMAFHVPINHRLASARNDGSELADEEQLAARKLHLLPTSAEEFYETKQWEAFGWSPALKTMLEGTRDDESCPLAFLRNHEATLVRHVYSFLAHQWAKHVRLTIPAALVGNAEGNDGRHFCIHFNHGRGEQGRFQRDLLDDAPITSSGVADGFVAFSKCGLVQFPAPNNRNVNMMPIRFGDITSLPEDLRCYYYLIEQCPYAKEEIGQVGYLTVHESYVTADTTQRRQGLHIESPGVFVDHDDPNNKNIDATASFTPGIEHHWGCGVFFGPDRYEGGIYFASSVSNTSCVWDALVDKAVPGIVDRHGGCEHLRNIVGPPTNLQAGELIWMTDCTPHEALPQAECGYRQFFRVVMPTVSHWYADNSTLSPKVPLPDHVQVVHGSKFGNISTLGGASTATTSSVIAREGSSILHFCGLVFSWPFFCFVEFCNRISAKE
jgi:hypothetical protein